MVATSVWSGAARVARRLTMPVAWMLTLGICAASAFAVRDVVFPQLGQSSAPALWEPRRSEDTAPPLSAMVSINSVEGPQPTDDVTTTATSVVTTSSSDAPASVSTSGSTGKVTSSKGPTVTTAPRTSAPSTTDDKGGASSSSAPTSSSSPSSSAPSTTDVTTTTAGSGDTIPDTTSVGGSGSGRGGDRHDPLP